MNKEYAMTLIIAFAQNQTRITKEANTRRGVTNKSLTQETKLIGNLLDAMKVEYSKDDIQNIIQKIS